MKTCFGIGGLVLAAMTIGALLLGSCSTASPPASETSKAETKPYGSLTVAINFRSSGIDPHNNSGNTFQSLSAAIFDSLVEPTSEGQARPGIAERWEISPDGMTHTFYIRKGVKFHDGSDLTGADVKFSLERILGPDILNSTTLYWIPRVAKVEIKDDYTVAMQMKSPQFELLRGFADFTGDQAVVPKRYIEEKGVDYFAQHPVGSGPFKVVKWEAGNRLDLEAVENHWRAVPKFKNVSIFNLLEEATKVAMLKTGEMDIVDVAVDSVPALKAAGVRIQSHDGAAQYYIRYFYDPNNPEKSPFHDLRVRRALSLATDRKEMADKLYGGYAQPSAFFYARPTAYFWDSNVLKADRYDPEGAKKLLAEAGYPNGFATKIWDMGRGDVLTQFNQAVAGYWRKVGVNAELAPIEQAALSKYSNPTVQPQVFNTARGSLHGGSIFQFEKVVMLYYWLPTMSVGRDFKNSKVNELIDKVLVTTDPAEKKRLALEAVVTARDEYYFLPVLDLMTVFAVGPKVGSFTPTKSMTGFGFALETVTHAK